MAKSKTKLIIGALVGIIIVLGTIGYLKKGGNKKGIEVELTKVAKKTIEETVTASGKVFPEVEVNISSDVSGEIIELYVQEGDSVKQGQVLARVDPDAYKSQVERGQANLNSSKAQFSNSQADIQAMEASLIQAEAQYQNTKAQVDNAKTIFERNQKLLTEGIISKAEFETAKASYDGLAANLNSSKASIDAARARLLSSKEQSKSAGFSVNSSQATLKEMRTSLKRTTIYAPISGIVSKLNIEKGERVVGTMQMTGTEIMRIANFNVMEVKVEVSENEVVRVESGDHVKIEVDAYLDRKFDGKVTLIANSASNATSNQALNNDQVTNFYVTIKIDPASYKDLLGPGKIFPFRPGMSASVDIYTDKVENELVVPIQAVTVRDVEESEDKEVLEEVVFVKQGDTAVMKVVNIGIQDNRNIHITSGLEEGMEVISGPYSVVSKKLKKGSQVKAKEKKKEEE